MSLKPAYRFNEEEAINRVLSPDDEAAQLALLQDQGAAPDNSNGEEAYDYREEFWLAKPYFSDEFAQEVCERFGRHQEQWDDAQLGQAVWNAYRAYHNLGSSEDDPITQLSTAGEVGELLALAVPHYRSLVRHQIALFTAERPAWDPQARTSDAAAARQVPMARNLLDFVASSGSIDKLLAEQCELMMVAGAAYFVTGWNANVGLEGRGWFTEQVFAPWELCHERVRVYEDTTWWIFRTYESRWEWVARKAESSPETARRIAEFDSKSSVFGSSFLEYDKDHFDEEGDRVAVLTLVAKPTLACPDGRLAKILDEDLVLEDGPYPFGDDVTISRLCASEFLGTSIPYSDSWGVLAPAEAVNAILSMILTRVDTCGVPNYAVPEGSELDFADIAGGNGVWKLPPGSEKPTVIDLLQIPDSLPAVMGIIQQQMEQTVGINSVTRGQPQENVSSGSMAALLQSMAIQFNSNLERAWVLNLEKIGTHHVRVFQRMATEPHAISIVGADQKWTVAEFQGEQLSSILRVAVKTASALSKTTAGRADIAEKLLERGGITPQEYLQVIQTGTLEPLFAGPVGELTTIKGRMEKLMNGQPSPALIWDNHQLCVREIKAALDTEVRDQPEVAQVLLQALDEHYQLWGQLSREDPDRLAAIGCPPLPQAMQMGQMAQQMQSMGMGAPPGPPAQHGPGPQQTKQPNTDAPRGRPGPSPAPKGSEPSKANPAAPSEPKPARTPSGESVV